MNITDVRIRMLANDTKMRAIASITFDGDFVIHDIKIIEGDRGLFIAMPSRKNQTGEYKDIAHPINTDAREKLQKLIIDEYNKTKEQE